MQDISKIQDDCWDRKTVRDCSRCPAHPRFGGPCCFGNKAKYNPADTTCITCTHRLACVSAQSSTSGTAASGNSAPRQRTVYPSRGRYVSSHAEGAQDQPDVGRVGTVGRVGRVGRIGDNPRDGSPITQTFTTPTEEGYERTLQVIERDGSLTNRFIKDGVFAAAQGLSLFSSWFFQNHRMK